MKTMATKTTTFVRSLCAAALLLAACNGTDADPGPGPGPIQPGPSVEVLGTQQSACKPEPRGEGGAVPSPVSAMAKEDVVTIIHEDAHYNCASKLKLEAAVSGHTISVREIITNPSEVVRCMCNFDLSVEVKGLPDGTYGVEVVDSAGQPVGSTSVTVGDFQPQVAPSSQSACKKNATNGNGSSAGSVSATAQGDTVTIRHDDATYNCASKVVLGATVTGSTIQVKEVITNPGVEANCFCTYDLSVVVKGLAPGTYAVTVTDAQGISAGSATVTVGGPGLKLASSKQSACKGTPLTDGPSVGTVSATWQGGTVVIQHADAPYNCASKVALAASLSGNDILVTETITNPGVLADCECSYDLSAEVTGLASGSYAVRVLDANQQLVGTTNVVVP